MQEIRWPGEESVKTEGMTLFYSGDKYGRHINGVGFLVNELLLPHVKHFERVSDRICYMRIADKSGDLILICVYAPTETGPNDEKEVFYEELERTYNKLPNHCSKILLGDFNAQVGNETMYKPTIGGESAHDISNGNGMRLIEYAIAKELIITSTFFPSKLIHKHTWTAPNNIYKSQIDHVLINKNHRSSISNIRSHRGADGDSDHFLVLICYKKLVTRKQKSNN